MVRHTCVRFLLPTVSRDEAAIATQGVPGARAHRLDRASQPDSQPKKAKAWAVFRGIIPGVYDKWYGPGHCLFTTTENTHFREEARLHVDHVSGSLHRGYDSIQAAQAAFEYAEQRSWTRVCGSASLPRAPSAPLPLALLPEPNGFSDGPNPLHGASSRDSRWYVVIRGLRPGVYSSR